MRDFADCNCHEGIENILLQFSRLTMLRPFGENDPFSHLTNFLCALNSGDMLLCVRAYHGLTASLLNARARRVSGEIWRDYLLHILIETSHPFAQMAAKGMMDEPLYHAMRSDLGILGALSALSDTDLKRFALERQRELSLKPRHAKDNIELMSSAVWSGSSVRPMPYENAASPSSIALLSDATFLPWRYGDAELSGRYASDEALEEVYIRLIATADWRPLIDDIWNFFAAYGSGAFIRERAFYYNADAKLVPISENAIGESFPITFYDMQRSRVIEHVIRFMRGERAANLLVLGGPGTGKTELFLSLLHEFPELRMVVVNGETCASLDALLQTLGNQPLKFILLLDNADVKSARFSQLVSALGAARVLPANVLLCAAAHTGSAETVFPLCIALPYPSLNEFIDIVIEMLSGDGVIPNREEIRAACIDHQVDARDKLSLTAARRIADEYIAKQGI